MALCRCQCIGAVVAALAVAAAAQSPGKVADEALSNSPVTVEQALAADSAPAEPDQSSARSKPDVEDRPLVRPQAQDPTSENRRVQSPSAASGSSDWWRMVGALALVLGLILALRWLARRWGGRRLGGGDGAVELLSRTPLSTRHSVLLVRVGKRILVVGAGGDNLRTLTEIEDPEQISELLANVRAGSAGRGFSRALAAWGSRMDVGDQAGDLTGAEPRTPAGGLADRVRGMVDRIRGGDSTGRGR